MLISLVINFSVFFICQSLVLPSSSKKKIQDTARHKSYNAGRIIGGKTADHSAYPFLVSIQTFNKTNWDHSCGGSILTPKVVLTAAHCLIVSKKRFKLGNPKKFRVIAGTTNLNETTKHRQERNAIKFLHHPDFNQPGTHEGVGDAGVIELDEPFSYNAQIQPLNVFSKEVKPAVAELRRLQDTATHCFSPGWGLVSKNPDRENTDLKVAKEVLLRGDTCRKILCPWSKTYCIDFSDNKQFCAAAEDASVCSGDSGGPMVCNGFVYGVISRGPGCYGGIPQVYTDIEPLLYFVNKYT